MGDRRSAERWNVEAHFDDLQSELEAGARTVKKIQRETAQLDGLMVASMDHAAIAGTVRCQLRLLMHSIAQQRTTLRELRSEMLKLRQHTARRR
jgi:tellurite resistance protein